MKKVKKLGKVENYALNRCFSLMNRIIRCNFTTLYIFYTHIKMIFCNKNRNLSFERRADQSWFEECSICAFCRRRTPSIWHLFIFSKPSSFDVLIYWFHNLIEEQIRSQSGQVFAQRGQWGHGKICLEKFGNLGTKAQLQQSKSLG
jgi:hypothetical protein